MVNFSAEMREEVDEGSSEPRFCSAGSNKHAQASKPSHKWDLWQTQHSEMGNLLGASLGQKAAELFRSWPSEHHPSVFVPGMFTQTR